MTGKKLIERAPYLAGLLLQPPMQQCLQRQWCVRLGCTLPAALPAIMNGQHWTHDKTPEDKYHWQEPHTLG